jgi:tetratricopeptide (TPR) repeat protein
MFAMRHAVVVALVFVPCILAGQQPPADGVPPTGATAPAFTDPKVATWAAAAGAHVAGRIDEPAVTIASWPRDHVSHVLGQLLWRWRRLRGDVDPVSVVERQALASLLLRGVSLHTDIAVAERDLLAQQAPANGRGAVLFVDGHRTRLVARSAHWAIARQIAAALAAVPDQRARVLAWYRAVGNGLQLWGDYDVAAEHLADARRWFPDDAMLALYLGTLHQTLGDARLQEFTTTIEARRGVVRRDGTERPDWAPSSDLRHVPRASRAQLQLAARELRRAVASDPGLHEARIRLAHVLSTLSDDQGAADAVRPALAGPLSPFLEYYGALILGRSEEHLGRYAEADAAYARAAALLPEAASARIGRSRAALAMGRAAEALAMITEVTAAPSVDEESDPWLSYLRRHDPDGSVLLSAWRDSLP